MPDFGPSVHTQDERSIGFANSGNIQLDLAKITGAARNDFKRRSHERDNTPTVAEQRLHESFGLARFWEIVPILLLWNPDAGKRARG